MQFEAYACHLVFQDQTLEAYKERVSLQKLRVQELNQQLKVLVESHEKVRISQEYASYMYMYCGCHCCNVFMWFSGFSVTHESRGDSESATEIERQ